MKCLMIAWQENEPELHGWLMKQLRNQADTDDLMQELFLKALRKKEHFCDMKNARAWLFSVARNALIDRTRLAKHQIEIPDELAVTETETPPVEMLSQCLPRALSEMSPEDREAISLCDIDGMSQQDFADRKGITLPGAKSRIQRARKRLRTHLETACRVRFDDAGKVCCFVPRDPNTNPNSQ